jgi:hypothetical protein
MDLFTTFLYLQKLQTTINYTTFKHTLQLNFDFDFLHFL